MAKTGGTPTTSFKIWEVPEDADRMERLARKNPEIDRWRSRINEHQVGGSAEKQVPKMTKFPRRCVSKGTQVSDNPKKTPENMKIPADIPKAPVKPRHAAKKIDVVPKRLEFPEAEDENSESMDSGFGASQSLVDRRYPTRVRISAQATQNDNRNQTKSSNAKPAKPKRLMNPTDVDKENDGSAANRPQPRQGTSSNKKRLSGFSVNRLGSQNLATPEGKEYAEELDLACDLANQALLLSPLERIEKFSWAAQVSGGVRVEDSNEGPAKKKTDYKCKYNIYAVETD